MSALPQENPEQRLRFAQLSLSSRHRRGWHLRTQGQRAALG